MQFEQDDRVFIAVPDDVPDWLREAMPPTGSSGKADWITPQAIWVNWGSGHEGWVPRAWLSTQYVAPDEG